MRSKEVTKSIFEVDFLCFCHFKFGSSNVTRSMRAHALYASDVQFSKNTKRVVVLTAKNQSKMMKFPIGGLA